MGQVKLSPCGLRTNGLVTGSNDSNLLYIFAIIERTHCLARQDSESVKILNNSKSISDFIEILKLEIINNFRYFDVFAVFPSDIINSLLFIRCFNMEPSLVYRLNGTFEQLVTILNNRGYASPCHIKLSSILHLGYFLFLQ